MRKELPVQPIQSGEQKELKRQKGSQSYRATSDICCYCYVVPHASTSQHESPNKQLELLKGAPGSDETQSLCVLGVEPWVSSASRAKPESGPPVGLALSGWDKTLLKVKIAKDIF
jgi:hypothetical protein